MKKPLIAIPRWKAPTWERTGYYLDSIEAADARCILVDEKKLPADAAGLLLMGGVDVNPRLYKERRSKRSDKPNNDRDEHELALLDDALARDIPVLAICRGHQLLNVAMGGSLVQHIEDDSHRWTDTGDSGWHDIEVEPDSRLAGVYGAEPVKVNSRHHQGVTTERVAPDLRVVASAHDSFVEGLESTAYRWVVGVQWHPERPEIRKASANLFAAFVKAAS